MFEDLIKLSSLNTWSKDSIRPSNRNIWSKHSFDQDNSIQIFDPTIWSSTQSRHPTWALYQNHFLQPIQTSCQNILSGSFDPRILPKCSIRKSYKDNSICTFDRNIQPDNQEHLLRTFILNIWFEHSIWTSDPNIRIQTESGWADYVMHNITMCVRARLCLDGRAGLPLLRCRCSLHQDPWHKIFSMKSVHDYV